MEYQYPNYIEILQQKGSVLGLDSMRCLLDELEHPENNLSIVHIAGTNGKGSTISFLASILQDAGYRVGRYISPTIQCYEERFQINGTFIDASELEELYETLWHTVLHMEEKGLERPTLFEVETALAFLYFNKKKVDFVLLETGMGGAEDATNVIKKPLLSILTSISMDHMKFLGNTLEKIATQKAGIIKRGCPSLLAENPEEVKDVVIQTAMEQQSELTIVGKKDYSIIEETCEYTRFCWLGDEYVIYLPGSHQVSNAVTALGAARILEKRYPKQVQLSVENLKNGLKNTRWPGRLELLSKAPILIRDGAHNVDAARKLKTYIEKHFTNKRILYIMGVLGDKEYSKMLEELLPLGERLYTFTPGNVRGLSGETLARTAREICDIPVEVYQGVNEALTAAKCAANIEDVLILCGSLSFMEEME